MLLLLNNLAIPLQILTSDVLRADSGLRWKAREKQHHVLLFLHTASLANTLCCCFMQYAELAFSIYTEYYVSATVLLAITLMSGVMSTRAAYKKRLQLYTSVARHHLLPCVQGRYVR